MSRPRADAAAASVFPIVGIGASAGGLEAVSRLLAHLPTGTGMAFVVVQHLDPTRESLLPAILQKATAMPVAQALDGGTIAPDHVYVIPPNTHMIVDGVCLRLIPRPVGAPALSVNCFLNSLAEQRGNKAVAVILSGTASDGSLGIQSIKSEGGLVFAQDEQSAGFFGMPQSAAATGVVDFILPPERIAEELASFAAHPALRPDVAGLFGDAESLAQIFQLLRRETGVDFGLYKSSTIERRLLRRLMLHKLKKLALYREMLEKNPDEIRALHDDLLIHVTRFFREPKSFAALRAKAFPRILKGLAPDASIRVWVAGCSTGEEAYSLGIALFDFLGERDSMNPVQIFATDISDVALERARAGVYPEEIRAQMPPRLLRRFFTKVDRGYEIAKRVRDACVFARQDLTRDPPFANVDLVSCCNVLIYLGADAQQKILPMFHYALRPHGALLLGSAETVGEFGSLFATADKKCRLYFKTPSTFRTSIPVGVRALAAPPLAAAAKTAAAPGWPETDVQKIAERLLLARFAPAGVVVGGNLDVLHFRGHVSRFLEPSTGKADLGLLKMLPLHAAGVLRALIQKAKKSDAPAKAGGIALDGDDARRAARIAIEVIPFRLPISGTRYFLVLFEDDLPASARAKAPGARQTQPAARPVRPESASAARLKNELASTRSYLQTVVEEHESANEELKAANEEIISSNEELQSTNEELEIAKEELQAANEELSTVNDELQTRNGDLGRLNDDLLNLISSVHLPIVMVSSDLRIRRFSPMAEKVMNLIPGDVGRPIGDIRPKMPLPNLEEILHEVIETVTAKELEVLDQDGHSFALRIRPYKTADNKIDGAVIVFIDNDPILRGGRGVEDVGAFEAALEMARAPLAILDAELRVRTGSRSMYQAYGLTPSALGRSLFEVAGGRWNVPALRAPLESLAREGAPFSGLPVLVDGRRFFFSARRVKGADGGPPQILLGIDDRA
jgi:two-component system CheB/CheR fusion protein